jgi:hypothetical protein
MHAEALRLRVSAVVIAAERCALRGAPPIGSECVARLSRVEGAPSTWTSSRGAIADIGTPSVHRALGLSQDRAVLSATHEPHLLVTANKLIGAFAAGHQDLARLPGAVKGGIEENCALSTASACDLYELQIACPLPRRLTPTQWKI